MTGKNRFIFIFIVIFGLVWGTGYLAAQADTETETAQADTETEAARADTEAKTVRADTESETARIETKFGFFSVVGYEHRFNAKNFELETAGMGLKTALNFSLRSSGFTIETDFTLAEMSALNNLYDRDLSLSFTESLSRLGIDLFSSPIFFLNSSGVDGEANNRLGTMHVTLGFPWLEIELGYKEAKLPEHQLANWVTVDGDWEAGYSGKGGYSVFKLGERLQNIGPVTLNVQIAPNRTADREGEQYGFYSFITAETAGHTVGLQYNGAYGYEYDKLFDEIYEADLIVGYAGDFGPLGIKANFLLNSWGAKKALFEMPDGTIIPIREFYTPASSDVSQVRPEADTIDNMAFAFRVDYTSDPFDAALGYQLRGAQANMMYVKEDGSDTHLSDQLGIRNTQRVYLSGTARPVEPLSVTAEIGADLLLSANGTYLPYYDNDNIELYFAPSVSYDLSGIFGFKSKVSAYTELNFCTADADRYIRGNTVSNFVASKIGLAFEAGELNSVIRGFEVHYGFDNQSEKFLYNSLLGTLMLPQEWDIQLGFMIRSPHKGVDKDNPYDMITPPPTRVDYAEAGFFLGAVKKLKILGGPSVYGQFFWNMDPYQSFNDGQAHYDLDGSLLSVPERNNGYSALRIGLRWEF